MKPRDWQMLATGFVFGLAWALFIINVLVSLHIPVWIAQ